MSQKPAQIVLTEALDDCVNPSTSLLVDTPAVVVAYLLDRLEASGYVIAKALS